MKCIAATSLAIALVNCTLVGAPKTKEPTAVFTKVYAVGDLPVWRTDPIDIAKTRVFAPQLLIKYLKAQVDSESWKAGGIRPLEKNVSLVVVQTQYNHEIISDAIASLREECTGEETRQCRRSQ
jgi:hypothetical protein